MCPWTSTSINGFLTGIIKSSVAVLVSVTGVILFLSDVMFEVISSDVKLGMFESAQVKDKDKDRDFKMTLQKPIVVCGDICVDFFHKPPRLGKKVNHTFCR